MISSFSYNKQNQTLYGKVYRSKGFNNQNLYTGDEVRVLSTMLWGEMVGKISEQDGKFIFKSNTSGIVYDLATVAYRVCSSI